MSFRRPALTARRRWRPHANGCRGALPPYKRPRRFEIAHDLPRTATGKVQRNKLRERGRLDPH
jgi:acyl-CoA synthetase (AMP-forming)/AMP-acid ligase II